MRNAAQTWRRMAMSDFRLDIVKYARVTNIGRLT